MKVPHPQMDEGDINPDDIKNYGVKFKAVIEGVSYISARSRSEAAQIFKDDKQKAFDRIEKFVTFKVTTVEEIQ